MSSIPLKECNRKSDCVHPNGSTLPATTEYFPVKKKNKDGLAGWCIACHRKYYREKYHTTARERQLAHAKERNLDPEYKAKRKAERQTEEYRAYSRERARRLWSDPEYRERKRREYAERPEIKAYQRQWRLENIDKVRKGRQGWEARNKSAIKAIRHRRKARMRNLPNNFTADDWNRALSYFHGCCAACGRQLDDLFGDHKAAADHWIPLSSPDCPGTVPTNMIPLCHGINGCNNRKKNKNPEQWLVEKFGKHKAKEISQRIQEYFTTCKVMSLSHPDTEG